MKKGLSLKYYKEREQSFRNSIKDWSMIIASLGEDGLERILKRIPHNRKKYGHTNYTELMINHLYKCFKNDRSAIRVLLKIKKNYLEI